MGETTNTLEQRNESQKRTIEKQVIRIRELQVWEKFASHLINHCTGKTITPENLEMWLAECQEGK